MEGNALSALFEAVNALGTVGVLIFMVIAFYRGDIIPKTVLDRILAVYEKQMNELTNKILDKLDKALGLKKEGE